MVLCNLNFKIQHKSILSDLNSDEEMSDNGCVVASWPSTDQKMGIAADKMVFPLSRN